MKLLLADDHTLFRDALVQYITRADPDVEVSVAADFPGALDIVKAAPDQDLVLLDLRMPGMNGLKGFEIMRDEYPNIPVALMSGVAESHDVNAAMELGAAGYFPKTLSGKTLLQGIQLVLSGERFMPTDGQGDSVMPSYYTDSPAGTSAEVITVKAAGVPPGELGLDADPGLTPREKEVLSYLAEGCSNKEIADRLGLQVVTVKLHVRGACRKLGAKNRTQAALMAREMGMESFSSQPSTV
ncbi:MAG: response regulator transcription factor [Alphaproteobacteria bacterium]|nr:response regulator transcription factor [Alphaproteobacteria bacterium]